MRSNRIANFFQTFFLVAYAIKIIDNTANCGSAILDSILVTRYI